MEQNTRPAGTPTRVSADDRADIIELYARYAWGLDLADKDILLSAFAEDGCFNHLWQGAASGHEAILKSMDELWSERQAWWYGRQHSFNHFIMVAHPEGVRVRCFFQILQFNVEYRNNFVFGIGTRDDKVVRRDGEWKFHKVFVNAWTSADQVPWRGERTINMRPPYEAAQPDIRPFLQQSKDPW